MIEADSNNAELKKRLSRMLAPTEDTAGTTQAQSGDQSEDGQPVMAEPIPGTCQ